MKKLKEIPIIPLVLGVLILVYAIVSYFVEKGFFSLTQTVGNAVIGVGLLAFAAFVVVPQLTNKSLNGTAKSLKTVEVIVILIGAIIGFILPLFGVDTPKLGGGSLWFGLVFVIDGALDLSLSAYNKLSLKKNGLVFAKIAFVALGTWVYAKNLVDSNIKMVTFLAMVVAGAYLLFIGLINLNKRKK